MRAARIKELGSAYYHVISRVVDRRMVFDSFEKENIRKLMRACEAFCAVRVLTWSVLDNHFHLVLYVPNREAVSDDSLLHRLAALYDQRTVKKVAAELAQRRRNGETAEADKLKARYTYRMYDLSQFAKTFKQRLSQGYNRRHKRKGTLWEERFKSLIVEGAAEPLLSLAAYVDLNAVRAGIVSDPKDYRYCGYGEAVCGNGRAREGLAWALGHRRQGWRDVATEYRKFLYVRGTERGLSPEGRSLQAGFSPQQVERVIAQGGEVSLPELFRCRVRYFIDGGILGTHAYVEKAFQRHRANFGPNHSNGARPMLGGSAGGGLCSARRLRLNPITAPVLV